MALGQINIGEDVLFQQLEDEVVLLNMSSQQYYSLNEVGSRMWELLMELHEPNAVVDRLHQIYDVDKDVLRADLDRLVADLNGAGLLKTC
jgi:hypothetical protein